MWLDEIERDEYEMRERFPQVSSAETPKERMARVLREQARVIRLLLSTKNEFGQQKYLDELSDDAKELLE